MKESPLSSADCRKRAEDYFDKDKCFEKYIELYEDIANLRDCVYLRGIIHKMKDNL